MATIVSNMVSHITPDAQGDWHRCSSQVLSPLAIYLLRGPGDLPDKGLPGPLGGKDSTTSPGFIAARMAAQQTGIR
jgi:hypothetical protein